MPESKEELWLHRLFYIIIIWRGIYGAFEIIVGFAFLMTPSIAHIAHLLVQGELAEDPTDVVATHINHVTNTLSTGNLKFVTFYLISYGAAKIFLTISLLRKKTWAYPMAVTLFSLFLSYQTYRIFQTLSITLLVVTITDFLALALIAHEYYHMRKRSSR